MWMLFCFRRRNGGSNAIIFLIYIHNTIDHRKIEKCESTTCTNVNAFVVPENEPTGSTEFTGATSITA